MVLPYPAVMIQITKKHPAGDAGYNQSWKS